MKPVIFDAEAREEFDEAAAYYEGQRAGLGADFVAVVEEAIERISQTPKMFPIHEAPDTRKCVLRRFPYMIFFVELDANIWIAAVAHQRRRPGYWAHRKP